MRENIIKDLLINVLGERLRNIDVRLSCTANAIELHHIYELFQMFLECSVCSKQHRLESCIYILFHTNNTNCRFISM